MASSEQKKRLLKAKIAVAMQDELGRVPTEDEVNKVFFYARVMYKAVLGTHYKRKEQKKQGSWQSSKSMKRLIKNYTTNIPVERTVAEIQKILSENGASAIALEYHDGAITNIFFNRLRKNPR